MATDQSNQALQMENGKISTLLNSQILNFHKQNDLKITFARSWQTLTFLFLHNPWPTGRNPGPCAPVATSGAELQQCELHEECHTPASLETESQPDYELPTSSSLFPEGHTHTKRLNSKKPAGTKT